MTHGLLRRLAVSETPALVLFALPFAAATVAGRTLPPPAAAALGAGLVTYALLLAFPAVDPLRRARWDRKPLPQARLGVAVAAAAFALLQARALFDGRPADAERLELLGVVALMAVIGNALPALPPNLFVGVRLPWTVRDRAVWARTHRLAGRLLVATSVLLAAAWPALDAGPFGAALVAGSTGALFVSAALSWRFARTP